MVAVEDEGLLKLRDGIVKVSQRDFEQEERDQFCKRMMDLDPMREFFAPEPMKKTYMDLLSQYFVPELFNLETKDHGSSRLLRAHTPTANQSQHLKSESYQKSKCNKQETAQTINRPGRRTHEAIL